MTIWEQTRERDVKIKVFFALCKVFMLIQKVNIYCEERTEKKDTWELKIFLYETVENICVIIDPTRGF